jgi:hypothetical protein
MRKSKVQTLIPLILRSLQIRLLLLLAHTRPTPLSLPIDIHVIPLRSNEQCKVVDSKSNQDLVTTTIQRLIVVAVDVLANDVARLDSHVVECGRDGAGPDCAGIARCDSDEDGVDVRVADEHGRKHPTRPWRCACGEDFECGEKREGPDLRNESDQEALIEAFGKPGPEEELEYEEDVCRDLHYISIGRYGQVDVVLTVSRLVSNVPKPSDRS